VRAGLDRVEALAPGAGFAEVLAGARSTPGAGLEAYARGEVGWHFMPNGSAFAFGEAALGTAGPSWQAGVGARVTW
jgi:hypothetical protein